VRYARHSGETVGLVADAHGLRRGGHRENLIDDRIELENDQRTGVVVAEVAVIHAVAEIHVVLDAKLLLEIGDEQKGEATIAHRRVHGQLAIKTYVYADLEPGEHSIAWNGVHPFTVQAGESVFFRIRNLGYLRRDDDADGRAAVLACRLVQTTPP
jgi:hypothetical protein